MAKEELNAEFWNQRYIDQNTPWDIGYAAPALINYVLENVSKKEIILIPGAGKAHEAIHLFKQGYQNIYVCDWAPKAFETIKAKAPDFPDGQLLCSDFFALDIQVDLIIEQTFFCAIHPAQRPDYVEKAAALLHPKGKIIGLLFASPFPFEGPPYGGTKAEYEKSFQTHFEIVQMKISEASIGPRKNNELFFECRKKGRL